MVKQSPLIAGFMSLELSVEVLCRALGVPRLICQRILCEAVLAGDFGMTWSRCGCERHVTLRSIKIVQPLQSGGQACVSYV